MPCCKTVEVRPLTHERVFGRTRIGEADRHTRKYNAIFRDPELAVHDPAEIAPCLLRARFKAKGPRQCHYILHHHTAVEPYEV
jgi:hypothetical protein